MKRFFLAAGALSAFAAFALAADNDTRPIGATKFAGDRGIRASSDQLYGICGDAADPFADFALPGTVARSVEWNDPAIPVAQNRELFDWADLPTGSHQINCMIFGYCTSAFTPAGDPNAGLLYTLSIYKSTNGNNAGLRTAYAVPALPSGFAEFQFFAPGQDDPLFDPNFVICYAFIFDLLADPNYGALMDLTGDINADGKDDFGYGTDMEHLPGYEVDTLGDPAFSGVAACPANAARPQQGADFARYDQYNEPGRALGGTYISTVFRTANDAQHFFQLYGCAADADLDGRCDASDNCPDVANFDQADGDLDGVGDACDDCPFDFGVAPCGCPTCGCLGDIDNDGDVDLGDLGLFLANYGCTSGCGPSDLDGDGDVDLADLGLLLGVYGSTC